MENKQKQPRKINETKHMFFKMVIKIDKVLIRLTRK